MEQHAAIPQMHPWLALRLSTGLSQREVERRLGWKRGHLSLIERGLPPSPAQAGALRRFYADMVA
jgi:transcriptional regulator with XRE-family HTH domain